MALNLDDPKIAAAIDDWADLAEHVASNPNHDYGPLARRAVDAAMRCDDHSMGAWHRLCRWVLFVTNRNERHRPLTDDEQRLRRIAERLYDVSEPAPDATRH